MTKPSASALASLYEKVDDLSRQELVVAYRALLDTLEAVRTCEEGDGRCRLCHHCVTRLYVTAKPSPASIPPRYTEAPWRRP